MQHLEDQEVIAKTYGMSQTVPVLTMVEITSIELRALAEVMSQEARNIRDSDGFEALERLSDRLLRKAFEAESEDSVTVTIEG